MTLVFNGDLFILLFKFIYLIHTVSLKHDGTVKMANLPVPSVSDWQTGQTVSSVCDRRDRQTAAETW